MDRTYGLVLGQGRSGTNWVVDCLDASPRTFCRNEPNECVPSLMDSLPNHWRIGADGARLAQKWDEVAQQTALHMGERDHRLNNPKSFVHPLSQTLGIAQISARPRMRQLASRVLWSWADGEWKMPRWVGRLDQPDIVAVFKFVQSYNWATWVLDNRPDVPVVQVVRHPGGRHESFLRRYIGSIGSVRSVGGDAEETRLAKIEQLRLLAPEKELAQRMGSVDALTLEEAETWFGVYQMEVFEQRAAASPKYLRIRYEDMVANPGQTVERVYEHFGLELTSDVRALIESKRGNSVFGEVSTDVSEQVHGWRDRLDPEVTERILAILETSSIADWWDDDIDEDQIAA